VAQVPAIPAGEGPVHDDLGVHHYLDGHTEERDGLKILKLIVADLAEWLIVRFRVRSLE
jgi:hypothetical protein